MASNRELLGAPYDSAAFIKLETIVASNDASLDFTTGFDSTKYGNYMLVLSELVPAVDIANLLLRVSSDGGSTFDSGSSDYHTASHYTASNNTTANLNASTGEHGIHLLGAVGSDAGIGGGRCRVCIYSPDSSNNTQVDFIGACIHHDSRRMGVYGMGERNSAVAVNGFQILFHNGNIASGAATLFGIPK